MPNFGHQPHKRFGGRARRQPNGEGCFGLRPAVSNPHGGCSSGALRSNQQEVRFAFHGPSLWRANVFPEVGFNALSHGFKDLRPWMPAFSMAFSD